MGLPIQMCTLKVKMEIGMPDIVVNNAGSYYLQVPFYFLTIKLLFKCLRTFVSATTPAGRGW